IPIILPPTGITGLSKANTGKLQQALETCHPGLVAEFPTMHLLPNMILLLGQNKGKGRKLVRMDLLKDTSFVPIARPSQGSKSSPIPNVRPM
ncbi:MAG: hypothetical protein AAF405_00150, partial [Pseudomonadota bacterium]